MAINRFGRTDREPASPDFAERERQRQLLLQQQQQQQQTVDLNSQVQNMLNQWQQGGLIPGTAPDGSLNPINAPFMPSPTGSIAGAPNDIQDAWQAGTQEAAEIFNLGQPQLDPMGYLSGTMANLYGMQDPTSNPYLDTMLERSNQAIADQVLSSMGMSGRTGTIDPATGRVNDAAINMIDAVGDNTRQFLGQQYQTDMNRAMQAMLGGGGFMSDTLQMMQSQPWKNLQNYASIVGQLTGSSPQQPKEQGSSSWDQLMGLAGLGLGFAGLPSNPLKLG